MLSLPYMPSMDIFQIKGLHLWQVPHKIFIPLGGKEGKLLTANSSAMKVMLISAFLLTYSGGCFIVSSLLADSLYGQTVVWQEEFVTQVLPCDSRTL